jgi:hypothetical protein
MDSLSSGSHGFSVGVELRRRAASYLGRFQHQHIFMLSASAQEIRKALHEGRQSLLLEVSLDCGLAVLLPKIEDVLLH